MSNNNNEVKRWKKKTWKNVDVLLEDVFYARTPDLGQDFPPTANAKYEVISENEVRSTVEEIPLDPLPETKETKNEETIKESPSVATSQPPKV